MVLYDNYSANRPGFFDDWNNPSKVLMGTGKGFVSAV